MDSPKEPIIRYGVENKQIPGDPKGWKMKECGNIAHWNDSQRYEDFPKFGETDFEMRNDPRITAIRQCLSHLAGSKGNIPKGGDIIRDTPKELVVDLVVEGFSLRLMKLHDISYKDKNSYKKATRAKRVDGLSKTKMSMAEPSMGRVTEDFLMAERIDKGETPRMPMHRPTATHPQGSENRKKWYKTMRHDAYRAFWIKSTRQQRDIMRAKAQQPSGNLVSLIQQIQEEDKSNTRDPFWSYQRDELAVPDAEIYEEVNKDILLVLDMDSEPLLCKFKGLFHLLYGGYEVDKVEEALRKWASLPPLPLPETSRHMVDEFIRDTKHPEMDLEKATTLAEIEQRQQCVAHYGTWAMKGRHDPNLVWKTTDTKFGRGYPSKVMENYVEMLMPTFTRYVLGLGSEVIRFLLSTLAPEEYKNCCDVFDALPDLQKMPMAEPTFATLAVLGINSYTLRHTDETDVDFGFAGLVGLGNYKGGDLCFPQLALRMPYQRGDGVIFRGAEMEHFVSDWTGYRVFLLYTNHQPVRNYAYHRVMGKQQGQPQQRSVSSQKPKPKPNDDPLANAEAEAQAEGKPEKSGHGQGPVQEKERPQPDSSETTNSELYSPCWMEPAEQEPEDLYETDVHGAGFLGRWGSSSGSGSGSGSGASSGDYDQGQLFTALPPGALQEIQPNDGNDNGNGGELGTKGLDH